jgi:hypothetical protein
VATMIAWIEFKREEVRILITMQLSLEMLLKIPRTPIQPVRIIEPVM